MRSGTLMVRSTACWQVYAACVNLAARVSNHEAVVVQLILANTDAVFQRSRLGRGKLHDARLVDEFAVKVRGAGEPAPGFDAEERGALRLGPNAELWETLPARSEEHTSEL